MYVTSNEETFFDYQTKGKESTKTTSNADFLEAMETYEVNYSNKNEAQESTDENQSEEYKKGVQRLFLLTDKGEYFKGTVFEDNQQLQNSFTEFLGGLDNREFAMLNIKFINSFGNSLMEDENGDIVAQGASDKNSKEEFASINSTVNFFQENIDNLEELNPRPTQMINLLTETMNVVKQYQTEDSSLEKTKKTEKTEEKSETNLWALFEDIKSLMKRGVTEEELKMMEDLMKEIFKKLDNDPIDQEDLKDANKLLKRLEDMILEIKKRITGSAIKDGDENSETGVSKNSLSFELSSGDTLKLENIGSKIGSSLINRIDEAINDIKEMKEAKEKLEGNSNNSNSSKEELELLNQLKYFIK